MLKTKAVILAKVETVYGTDSIPTAALNAILCSDPTIEAIGAKVERNNIKSAFGARRFTSIGEGLKVSFGVELRGNGTSGSTITANEVCTLLRGCAYTQTITTTTGQEKVTMAPNSSQAGESLTIYYYLDGLLHKVVGARGTWSLEGKVNEFGKLKFEFTGIYDGPTDTPLVVPTLNATPPPLLRNAAFRFDTYDACIDGISITGGNEIAPRKCINAPTGIMGYQINERSVTASISPEMVTVAEKNIWNMWETSGVYPMTITFGATAGNRCTIAAPAAQIDTPKYGDRDNIVTAELPLVLTPTTAGNDEISFVFN